MLAYVKKKHVNVMSLSVVFFLAVFMHTLAYITVVLKNGHSWIFA